MATPQTQQRRSKTLKEMGVTWQNKDTPESRRKQTLYLAANHPKGVGYGKGKEWNSAYVEPVINSKGEVVMKKKGQLDPDRSASEVLLRTIGRSQRRNAQTRPNVGRGRFTEEVPKQYKSRARQYTFNVSSAAPYSDADIKKGEAFYKARDKKAQKMYGSRYKAEYEDRYGKLDDPIRTIKTGLTLDSPEEAKRKLQEGLITIAGTQKTFGYSGWHNKPQMKVGRQTRTEKVFRASPEWTKKTGKLTQSTIEDSRLLYPLYDPYNKWEEKHDRDEYRQQQILKYKKNRNKR